MLALVALLGSGLAAVPALASDPNEKAPVRTTCTDVTGYMNARKARTVHAGPDRRSRVLGKVSPPWGDGDGASVHASFDILASENGWLLIEGAGYDPVLTDGDPGKMYGGRGWIEGSDVIVGVQASQGFAAPSHDSEMIVRTRPNELDMMSAVVACDGKWVLARYAESPHRKYRYSRKAVLSRDPLVLQAWVTGICNIQETGCDMAPGDRPTK